MPAKIPRAAALVAAARPQRTRRNPLRTPAAEGKVYRVRPVIPIDEADEDADPAWPDRPYARRRRGGGWVVAAVMLAALGLLSLAVERKYQVVELALQRVARQNKVDPRIESFLAAGERALTEGDLDEAQGDFDKASVLTERDPRAILGQARVAAAKADIPWLKARLAPAGEVQEIRTAKAQLDERVATAQHTADEALSLLPQDPRALRAKLDSLRLAGDVDAARGYVVAVFAQASQPETAYVLAALDLAQPGPPLAAVVDRLRLAAGADARAGRAQAALVYALVKSGDLSGARAELAKLDESARSYPLVPDLHAWVGAAGALVPPSPPPVVSAAPAPAESSPSTAPQAPGPGVAQAIEAPRGAAPGPDRTLQAAGEAIGKGDLERAERIYQGILASNPDDSQALAGLGDVLRMRHDPQGSIAAYKRAIAINPSYVPAVLGLGDTQWAEGDHAGAARTYKGLIDHFPEGTYPGYARQRAAAGQ